jgi:WD40 repeat protein
MLTWDVSTGVAAAYAGEGNKNQIIGMAACPSGVVTCGLDGTLVLSPEANKFGTKIDLGMEAEAPVAFGCGRTLCVTASSKDRLIVTILPDGKCVSVKLGYSPTAVSVAASDSQVAIGGSDKLVHVLGPDGNELFKLERHKDAISVVAFSADCTKIASGCQNKEIVIWSSVDGTPLVTGLQGFHTARISAFGWSPGGTLASAGVEGMIIVWEVAEKEAKAAFKKPQAHIAGAVTALVFQDDKTLISTGFDACIKVWKL